MFFSTKSIKEANLSLRMAMEDVAGKAERLAKERAQKDPPPFQKRVTLSLYSRVYSTDGCEARDKRAQQRRVCTTGIDKLGEKEYTKLLQEIDQMSQMPINMEQLIDKWMKEIAERLEAEQQEKEEAEQRKTRSQASKTGTSKDTDTGPVPARRSSPQKRKADVEPKKDTKKKTDDEPKKDTKKKTDVEPKKDKPTKETGDKTAKTDDTDDASKNRREKGAKQPRQKKTAAIPMLMDDDDDLMIVDDKDREYEPQPEEEDDNIYPMDDDDDDDFQEPPPRARKTGRQSDQNEQEANESYDD